MSLLGKLISHNSRQFKIKHMEPGPYIKIIEHVSSFYPLFALPLNNVFIIKQHSFFFCNFKRLYFFFIAKQIGSEA